MDHSRTIRFALLGTGDVADRWHAPAFARAPGTALHAVLSRDPAKAARFAAAHGATRSFTDLRTLLADPLVDAVIVATPDALHADAAVLAAEAGKHVLVEKPMATSVEDAERMIDAARKNGVKLGVAYHHRWHAGLRQLAQEVHAGSLGTIDSLRIKWRYPSPDAHDWRASSNVGRWWSMAALGTHALDLIRWMLVPVHGEPVVTYARLTDDNFRSGRDGDACVMLRFPNGVLAKIDVSVTREKRNQIVFTDNVTGPVAVCRDVFGPRGAGRIDLRNGPLPFEPVDPYAAQLVDFAAAIHEDRAPEVDGEEGLRNLKTLIDIECAAKA